MVQSTGKYANKSHKKLKQQAEQSTMLKTVPVATHTPCTSIKFHIPLTKFLFGNTGNMKIETLNRGCLLCKVSKGSSRRMFKLSLNFIQFLFSEHLAF
jgi:hypothetical protein